VPEYDIKVTREPNTVAIVILTFTSAILGLHFEPNCDVAVAAIFTVVEREQVDPCAAYAVTEKCSHFELCTINTICSSPAFSPAQHKCALHNCYTLQSKSSHSLAMDRHVSVPSQRSEFLI
jgi:hypothetical protein